MPSGMHLGGFGLPRLCLPVGAPQSEALLALGSILNTWMLKVQTPSCLARHRSPTNDSTPPQHPSCNEHAQLHRPAARSLRSHHPARMGEGAS